MENALLVLCSGQVFYGNGIGQQGISTGEAVFTTGMTGYLETLTDPSYYGQIVVQTFPLIGNYGFIEKDMESASIHLKGYIVSSLCDSPSNFRSKGCLDDFLKKHNIVGIQGIDTRQLTKILREAGVMNARIIAGDSKEAQRQKAMLEDPMQKEMLLKEIAQYRITSALEAVTCSAKKIEEDAKTVFENSALYKDVPIKADGTKLLDLQQAMKPGEGKKVVLWDFGAKANIRRELLKRGLEVEVVPCSATAKDILDLKPQGIMLSNGPGDPQDNTDIIEEIKKLCKENIAIFGICLGHQLLALAMGAKTTKLKYGHRGANQPVKNLKTGRIYITSQNHGYAVDIDSIPRTATLTYKNLNDGTCEGIEYQNMNAFSVQFHPEACAGPLDTGFLFDEFVSRM